MVEEEVTRAEVEVRQLLNEDHVQERSRLHDDIFADASTEGLSSEIQEDCRKVTVRHKRSDGVVVMRKIDRCLLAIQALADRGGTFSIIQVARRFARSCSRAIRALNFLIVAPASRVTAADCCSMRGLRRILNAYAADDNELRTHRSLNKNAPIHRAIERLAAITSHPILGGLHHEYCRI